MFIMNSFSGESVMEVPGRSAREGWDAGAG